MRPFFVGAFLVVFLAFAMEAANAQAVEYTNEDLLNAGIYGVGFLSVVLGFITGKQR